MKLIVEADGGSRGNPGLAAYGAVVREAGSGRVLAERAAYLGEAVTNNVAEYSGLIAGLEAAAAVDPAAPLEVRMDSKLVVQQMSGVWKIKNEALAKLADQARAAAAGRPVAFKWVPRARNQAADALANEAMDSRGAVARGAGGAGGAAPGAGARDETASSMSDAVRAAQAAASGAQRHPGATAPATTLILVRHGMSVDTGRDVFGGAVVPGPGLSAEGRLQAAAALELGRMLAAPWFALAAPTALLASPTARTRQTAEPFAREFGLAARVEAGFVEQDFGLWDGLTKAEVDASWPGGVEAWAQDAAYTPAGGESRQALGARVKAALGRLVGERRGQTTLVVSHAMAIRAAIGAALGAPPAAWFGFRVAPASLNILRLWDLGRTEVVCTNRVVAP
ncbi:MAG: bifunctional RNase H/acid phosphatase [Bifidobacteriaceae bacterium]|nr:bifunctional RNase H/acid phosphatase [Bifidobacteriaceae bacterium]